MERTRRPRRIASATIGSWARSWGSIAINAMRGRSRRGNSASIPCAWRMISATWAHAVSGARSSTSSMAIRCRPRRRDSPVPRRLGPSSNWITEQAVRAEVAKRGRQAVLCRLNREEYRNTIRDLLGIAYDPSGFPEDSAGGRVRQQRRGADGLAVAPGVVPRRRPGNRSTGPSCPAPGRPRFAGGSSRPCARWTVAGCGSTRRTPS